MSSSLADIAADLHRLADLLRDTGWQPFQMRDTINMGIRRHADTLAALAGPVVPQPHEPPLINLTPEEVDRMNRQQREFEASRSASSRVPAPQTTDPE